MFPLQGPCGKKKLANEAEIPLGDDPESKQSAGDNSHPPDPEVFPTESLDPFEEKKTSPTEAEEQKHVTPILEASPETVPTEPQPTTTPDAHMEASPDVKKKPPNAQVVLQDDEAKESPVDKVEQSPDVSPIKDDEESQPEGESDSKPDAI